MLRYSPGAWQALVTPGGIALLAPDVPLSTVEAMWNALPQSAGGLAVILEGLVGTFGTSLSSLPSFAVVTIDEGAGEARVAVRGPVRLTATLAGGATEQISGLGVTTWSEKVLSDPSTIELTAPGGGTAVLPVRDGVVLADAVRWIVRADADTEVPDAAPAVPVEASVPDVPPVAPAEPEPESAPAPEPEPALTTPSAPAVVPVPDIPAATETGETTVLPDFGVTELPADDHTRGYEDLIFGETRLSTVEDAAVRDAGDSLIQGIPPVPPPPLQQAAAPAVPPPPAPAPPASAPSDAVPAGGDHDGETISLAQLSAMQGQIDAAVAGLASPAAASVVWATLIVSTGERFTLDRSAVIGRRPRAVRSTGVVPHLVAVPSPDQDISRSHLELRVEGTDVVAVDLDTTNGTLLLRVGADPVRLQPGESTLLVAGDRLDLGDGIGLSFEGLA